MYRTPTACKHRVSGSFSLPSRGPFHLSFTVLCAIGHWVVFSLGGWSPRLPARFHVSRSTPDPARSMTLSPTGLSPSLAGLSRTFPVKSSSLNAVHTPGCTHPGLGSSAFARRYLRNHCCFLFLSLLRCFSSGGSRLHTMDSCTVAAGFLQQVSPFRDPRITGYLLLPAAYRSLSRLSSAPSAKASTLRSFCLTAWSPGSAARRSYRPASVRVRGRFGHDSHLIIMFLLRFGYTASRLYITSDVLIF